MPTPRVKFNKWNRRLHRWGGLAVVLPLGLVIATGLLLQLKKQWSWVQPPTSRGVGGSPEIGFETLLDIVRGVPEAGVEGWGDIDRIDVQPGRGIVKVRCFSRWEVQIDTSTGDVLRSAYRRSDLIETLHDGSFFGEWVKLGVFLPAGVVLLLLWMTGVWLWWMPHGARRRKRRLHGVGSAHTIGHDRMS